MRLGLIARSEIARGIAVQSKNFYDHMPVDKVLLIKMPRPDCALGADWYPGATEIAYDDRLHQLDEATVRAWLADLDVVFTVETPNDWRMPHWCREMGVKLVVQGNPEFVRHGQPGFEGLGDPTWWWPTSWRLDQLPPGPVVPVPMPDREITAADPHDGPLRVLHIVGKRAFADRNGTDIFIRAIQRATRPIHVTMHSIDEHLPDVVRSRYLSVDRFPSAVDDRWEMYRDQHVLVLPRRYGGLCLPALEAAACGLAVVMPDASPNRELASVLVEPRPGLGRMLKLACGSVREIGVNYVDFGETLNQLAADRNWLGERMAAADDAVPRWSRWRAEYMRHLAEPS